MKIAIDIKLLVQTKTGIAAFIKNLLMDVHSAPYHDMEIYLLCPDGAVIDSATMGAMKSLSVVKPHFMNSMLNHFMYDQWSILKTLNKLKPDVFYVPYFDIPYFYNGTLITSIHDMTMYNQSSLYPKGQRLYFCTLLKRAIERSKYIVTISNTSKREICSTFSFPPENVIVWYIRPKKEFLTTPDSNTDLEQIRKKYSLPEEFILYTGGVDPRKNIDGLVRSYRKLKSMKAYVPSLVITGASKDYSMRLLRDLGVNKENDSVCLPGYIDERDLPFVYALSLFTVYASSYEGFGIPLVESMASGKAVCCPDIELFHEVAGDVPMFYERTNDGALAEAMLRLLTDTPLRKSKEKDGLKKADFYKNINHAQSFENLLRQAAIR
jgi:glycosyltransferase involved in cell wall biosynthesis